VRNGVFTPALPAKPSEVVSNTQAKMRVDIKPVEAEAVSFQSEGHYSYPHVYQSINVDCMNLVWRSERRGAEDFYEYHSSYHAFIPTFSGSQ